MATVLEKFFKSGTLPEEVSAELRSILTSMQRERKAFDDAVLQSQGLTKRVEDLGEPIGRAQQAVQQIEEKVQAFEDVVPKIEAVQQHADSLQHQADGLRETTQSAEDHVRQVNADAAELRAEVDQMKDMLRTVVSMKADLEGLMELEGRFKAIEEDATELSGTLGGMKDTFTQIKSQQEQLLRTNAEADTRLSQFSERYGVMTGGLEEAERRVAAVEETLGPLAQVAQHLPDTKRQLSTLRALGEHVMQKIAGLEQQRDSVDRASSQAAHLSEMVQQIDRQIQQQQASAAFLTDLADDVGTMRTSHSELDERLQQAVERQRKLDVDDRTRHDDLVKLYDVLREQVANAQARFEFERAGLDSVSQRIVDLRDGLTSMEHRFHALGEATNAISTTERLAEQLTDHTAILAEKLADVEPQVEEVANLRAELGRMDSATQDLRQRIDAIQDPVTTNVDAAEQRVADVEVAVSQLEARALQVEGLSEKIKHASQQLVQGDSSLEKSMEHLDEVTELRRESGTLVAQLEQHIRTLQEGLAAARQQGTKLTEFAGTMQQRADNLAKVQDAITRFESRFADWESAEQRLAHASEQAVERQGAVDAVRDELHRMFRVAEETVEQVRTITAARNSLGESKEMLDDLMVQIRTVRVQSDNIDDRQRQFEEAEEQFSRIEALMLDMEATMKTLLGQQAYLDQVVSVAGSLTFQNKQAEALITTLRSERQISERINPSN